MYVDLSLAGRKSDEQKLVLFGRGIVLKIKWKENVFPVELFDHGVIRSLTL